MIYAKIPFLPPSVNHVFFQRGRMRILTKEGKKYHVEVQTHLARECQPFLSFFQKNIPYAIIINLNVHAERLLFKGWPEKSDTRYKAFDASNYIKVLEDAVVKACGHDDRQHITVAIRKSTIANTEEEYVELWAFNLTEELSPIDEFVLHHGT